METFDNYRSFGIRYYSLTGTTVVEDMGLEQKRFQGLGQNEGEKQAKKYIDGWWERNRIEKEKAL